MSDLDNELSGFITSTSTLSSVDGISQMRIPQQSLDVNECYKVSSPDKSDVSRENNIFNADVLHRLWRILFVIMFPEIIHALLGYNRGGDPNYMSVYLGIIIATGITFYFINLGRNLWPCYSSNTDAYLFKICTTLGSGTIPYARLFRDSL